MSVIQNIRSHITRLPFWWMYLIALVLLAASGFLWWQKVYLSPDRVFWGMIENNLSTRSVIVESSQQGQDNGSNVQQFVQYELGTKNMAYSLTKVNQGATKVDTEIVGTTKADYYRYRNIETDQKGQNGKAIDTKNIEGIWAKSNHDEQTQTQSGGQKLFAQAVLGIGLPVGSVAVPTGDLQPSERQKLLKNMKDRGVYEAEYKSVKKQKRDGRLVYVYKVKMQTILYVTMMKQFAGYVGLDELNEVDSNSYQTSAPLEATFVIDAQSRHLVATESATGTSQKYSGYNLPLQAEVPQKTIPLSELNSRLQEL
jgi:hypothetical protein